MKKQVKKELMQWVAIVAVVFVLWITGWYVPVIGFLQRSILQTGIMRPNVEQTSQNNNTSPTVAADFNFNLINSEGKQISLEKFRGKVVFLNVWATWCMPCRAEMPSINNLYKELEDENVEFVMLSVDANFSKAKNYVAKENFDFPIYSAAQQRPEMYSEKSIPTTYIIDANGNLALTHFGMADYDTAEFKEFLRELM